MALRCFAAKLPHSLHTTPNIAMSTVSMSDFYWQLCETLGYLAGQRKSAMILSFQNRIAKLHAETCKPLFLMLDESH
ncbi:MAG: hypothetical protein FWG10_09200 [Eubacteriaceae bacterium]|nr:hypothetical protein [Eubacteriaceae bacterium]